MGRSLRSGRKIASISPPKKRTTRKSAKGSAAAATQPTNTEVAPEESTKKTKSTVTSTLNDTKTNANSKTTKTPGAADTKQRKTRNAPKKSAATTESTSSSKRTTRATRASARKKPQPKKESVDSSEEEEKEVADLKDKSGDVNGIEEEESGSSSEEESLKKSTPVEVEKKVVSAQKIKTPPKKKQPPLKQESSSEEDSSEAEDEGESPNEVAPVKAEKVIAPPQKSKTPPKKKISPKKKESSSEEDGSDESDADVVENVAPAPTQKSQKPTKKDVSSEDEDGSDGSDSSDDNDEVQKVIPLPLKKSKAPLKKDESSDESEDDSADDDDGDESSSADDTEDNNDKGFTDDNSNWLKPKQKMKLMSSDEEDVDDDEFDAAASDDDEEMLEVERQSRLVDAEMELEREEAASELRRTIAQQTAVFHLPTAEELEEDENRVVPPSELRARIDDVLEVLASFRARREPGRSRSEYVERLGQDMAELFGYLQELVDYFLSMFGPNECLEFLEASERSRPLVVRVNTLRARRKDLAAALMKRGVRLDPLAPWSKVGLKIHESTVPVGATPEYLAGHYMLQSAASMCPVMAMGVKPGDRVLDMSAAPGGKTSYISQLMRNKGVVIANDLKPERQKATVANLHRLGVRNVVTCCYDGRKIGVQFRNSFDRILLDAPCSGLGVISRDPSVKVQRTMPDVRRCAHLQKELLVAAIDALNYRSKKGGGYMVYSTCSVAVAENEEVVNYLLSKRDVKLVETGLDFGKPGFTRFEHKRFHPSVSLTRRFYPHVHNMDGFFVAKIQKLSDKRKGAEEENKKQTEITSDEVKVHDANKSEKAVEKTKSDTGGNQEQQNAKKKKGKKKRKKPTSDGSDGDDQARKKSKKISYAPRAVQQVQNVQKKKKTNAKVTKPRRMKITGM